MRVIPSFLSDGADNIDYQGSGYDSIRLVSGEVQKIYQPDDPLNVNKKVPEYDVWAGIYENGTFANRTLRGVTASDLFGSGLADTFTFTYRADPSATIKDNNNRLGVGLGSKVLGLAINGSRYNYLILGGLRNSKADPVDSTLGHNLKFSFNGITATINNDGELVLTYGGANNADGSLRDGVDESSTGSTITITKDGNISIADGSGVNSIVIDHANNQITTSAGQSINLTSPQVNLGELPTTPAVLGLQLVNILTQLITAIQTIQVQYLGIPSTPGLINAPAFAAIQAELETILSSSVNLQ